MAAMNGPAKDFADYLAAVPEPARTTLEKVRSAIRATDRGHRDHQLSHAHLQVPGEAPRGPGGLEGPLLPAPDGVHPGGARADLEKHDTGKGTIRFPVDKPLPAAVVRKWSRYGSVKSKAARGTALAREFG
jgi:uncharacterized protein YdhG (YjbR/CyaY superfamily)